MPKLYVIRHAHVDVNPNAPSDQWHISKEGIAATNRMIHGEDWSKISCIYHSPEHKAAETAELIANATGLPMKVECDLRELTTTMGFVNADVFTERVGAYLQGSPDPDFEDYGLATDRIVDCIRKIVDNEKGRSVAVVSHGRILSAFYSFILGRRISKTEWQSIKFPDLSVIDTDTWRIERGFLAHTAG